MENIFIADETVEQIEQNGAAPAESNTENDVVSLAEALSEEERPEAQAEEQTEEAPTEKPKEEPAQAVKEPAWFRRQLAAERSKWNKEKADYEAKLAAYAEKDLEAEAEKLAATENISKNIALRILRAERGMPVQPKAEADKPAQQRDASGRFVKAEPEVHEEPSEDPARVRAQELISQNEILLKTTGVNALELYQTNSKVAQKVNSGEWDFADVVKAYMEETGGRRVPAPVRSANGANVRAKSIADLSDKEWEALNKKLDMGYVIDPGR